MTRPSDIADISKLPQEIATALHRRGLGGPALLLLEVGRPLALLGGQVLWLAQPALGLFGLGDSTGRLAQLLEDPAAMRALMTHLDKLEGRS